MGGGAALKVSAMLGVLYSTRIYGLLNIFFASNIHSKQIVECVCVCKREREIPKVF